jgi:hypothetical protein
MLAVQIFLPGMFNLPVQEWLLPAALSAAAQPHFICPAGMSAGLPAPSIAVGPLSTVLLTTSTVAPAA